MRLRCSIAFVVVTLASVLGAQAQSFAPGEHVVASITIPATAGALQTTAPQATFGWNIATPDLATAQAGIYTQYLDGATTGGTVLQNVTCAGTTPFACQASEPLSAVAGHTITITYKNAAGESAPSNPLAVPLAPVSPTNLHLIKIG